MPESWPGLTPGGHRDARDHAQGQKRERPGCRGGGRPARPSLGPASGPLEHAVGVYVPHSGREVLPPILEGADLGKLLEHAGAWRALFAFLAYTGLRISEALGVRWLDVDFDAGVLHVRQQLSRHRTPKHLKTDSGRRDVVLAPGVTPRPPRTLAGLPLQGRRPPRLL